jgi:BlaI family transcriptional regulator, penicillinase repressor
MTRKSHANLSRRERQIMDIIYQLGRATAQEVQERLPNAPSYSAARALLRLLEEKGYLRHEQDGPRYIYLPTLAREKARTAAIKQVLKTFFDDSAEEAVAALLDVSKAKLKPEEFDRLSLMIAEAKKEGR